ncbi:MAG TPA: hypothetical protein PKZ37_15015 [Gallionellaceae bacterium]|jgi:hypothetical protein|nr:hypothetical protein [Gallionellaceae bacterium]
MQAASNMIASRPEMGITAYREEVGYFRPCQLDERLEDVAIEAKEHGSIIAVRGSVFCIMPVLIDGWTKVNVGWKQ